MERLKQRMNRLRKNAAKRKEMKMKNRMGEDEKY